MKLNIKERYALRNIFAPKAVSLLEADLLDELISKIKITQDEMKKVNMQTGDNTITWDIAKDKGIDVEISQPLLNLLQAAVKAADQEKRIPYDPDDKTAINLARKILDYQREKK